VGLIGRTLALLATALAFGASAQAAEVTGLRFRIVTADQSQLTQRIQADLQRRMLQVYGGLRVAQANGARRHIVVAIGPAALRQVLARPCDCVVIGAYTSSQAWQAMATSMPSARLLSVTNIFAEPAPADQLRLVSLLFKSKPVRVAALLSHDTQYLRPVLAEVDDVRTYTPGEDVTRLLGSMSQARVLLAVPDQAVYTAENIRNILLSTYRLNQAVIGFSADMVRAGALASTYSDVDHINAHIADLAAEYLDNGELAAPQFPRYFSTTVNEGVARSLDVPLSAIVRRFSQQPLKRP